MTGPIDPTIPDASLIGTPDPNSKIGPMNIQFKRNWQAPLVAGIVSRMQRVGAQMVAEAREIAPRASGTLSDSIYSVVIQPRGSSGRFGDAVLIFGAKADYALPVEFGHATTGGTFVEAQPFLRPVAMKKRAIG